MSNGSTATVNEDDRLYSIHQAAEFLQIHRATIYRLIAAGKLRYYRVLSNRIRFSRVQLEDFLQCSERNANKLRRPRKADLID